MSKILRRPMFRGGKVSSYGTGIASGLGYNTGGRVGYQTGGGIITLQDILKQGGAPMTGQQILDFAQKNKLNLGPDFRINSLSTFIPEEVTVGQGTENERDISYGSFVNQFGVPKYEDEKSFVGGTDPQGTLEVLDKVQIKTDELGKPVTDELGNPVYVGSQDKIKSKLALTSDIPVLNKQNLAQATSDELSLDEVRDALGYAKARRRDVGDMLGRASAAFLKRPARGETRGITEALGDFMETETAAGPGRAEQIETGAATFMLKERQASKRAKEQVELFKGQEDYRNKLGENMSLPKAILAANKSGTLNNKELAAGIQGATSPNTGKNYNFKGIVTRDALNKAMPTAQEGDTFIVQETVKDPNSGIEKTIKVIIEVIDGQVVPIYRI
jgi:hypothetical protein